MNEKKIFFVPLKFNQKYNFLIQRNFFKKFMDKIFIKQNNDNNNFWVEQNINHLWMG